MKKYVLFLVAMVVLQNVEGVCPGGKCPPRPGTEPVKSCPYEYYEDYLKSQPQEKKQEEKGQQENTEKTKAE